MCLVGRGVATAYAALPDAYAYCPMLAIQSASPSDHLHLPSGVRELLLSRLMRPDEYVAAALSPLSYLLDRARRPNRERLPES